MVLKFRKISETSAVEFCLTEKLHLLLLKLYLPLVHKIAFAKKFQLNHKIKHHTLYIYSVNICNQYFQYY